MGIGAKRCPDFLCVVPYWLFASIVVRYDDALEGAGKWYISEYTFGFPGWRHKSCCFCMNKKPAGWKSWGQRGTARHSREIFSLSPSTFFLVVVCLFVWFCRFFFFFFFSRNRIKHGLG